MTPAQTFCSANKWVPSGVVVSLFFYFIDGSFVLNLHMGFVRIIFMRVSDSPAHSLGFEIRCCCV